MDQEAAALARGDVDHLAAVRRRALPRGDRGHAPDRVHERGAVRRDRARGRARALPGRRLPLLPAPDRPGADPLAGLLPTPPPPPPPCPGGGRPHRPRAPVPQHPPPPPPPPAPPPPGAHPPPPP